MPGLGLVSYLVPDQGDALRHFTEDLGWVLREDTQLPGGKRWVVVAPPEAPPEGAGLLLAKASTPDQLALVGKQGAGRVWLFWHCQDFASTHARLVAKGVRFLEAPRHEAYGSVAVFEDAYGNAWDLIEPK